MLKPLLKRDIEYRVKGVNYNRTIKYGSKGQFDKSLLRIEPHQDVRITITVLTPNEEAEVVVKKHDTTGKKISESTGIIAKHDLIKLFGLDE